MDKQLISIKQRYGIIGFDPALDYAIHIAVQVATTDLSVLITGESGVGKENFPKIIHDFSPYKHGQYIAVNCGAIPEGTIDSELFGHEKGSFTGATESRKGYFEVADGGTIFLDEVADLPFSTQVRLLRVLENGEFLKVGSSKPQKTKVRVIAATNVNIAEKIAKGKFREDLFYRLNSVPIHIPPLRERKEDIFLLFTKFATDFAFKYQIPPLQLSEDAKEELSRFDWPGNVRQLRNVTEQMSLIEKERNITKDILANYLVTTTISNLPVLMFNEKETPPQFFERELIYKFLTDLTKEVAELKKLVHELKTPKTILPEGKKVEFTDYQPIEIQEENNIITEEQQINSLSLNKIKKGKQQTKGRKQKSGFFAVFLCLVSLILMGCSIQLSMTGGSVDSRAKTVYVATFPNNASLVNPNLAQDFTTGLKDRIQNQTPLTIVDTKNADYIFDGAITNYSVSPTAIQGNDLAAMNRLTISVRVSFKNSFDDKLDFDQTFSRYSDYASNLNFTSIESGLMQEIVTAITEDIFNKAFVNW